MNQSQVSESIKRLKGYFEQQADILLAFVFGSVAAGFAGEDSDFDVAVYLKDMDKEIKIWRDISRIINFFPAPTPQGEIEFGGHEKFYQYILEHTLPDTRLFLID